MIIPATILLILAFIPYLFYTYGIFFGKKQDNTRLPANQPPRITIIFSAYNEGKNIERRLKNLKACAYPKMDLVIVDDCSSDNTFAELKKWLWELNFTYHLLRNETRMGVSASYNLAIANAHTDIIVVTDADVTFKEDALHMIVERLTSDDKIGAVTGDLQPDGAKYQALAMEEQYRSVYGDMCEWESAHDSTFNFNGALIAFRKSAIHSVPKDGADDANIAFKAIRNGYRAVYDSRAIVYDTIPTSISVQFRQKVRRAHGILLAMWDNRDLRYEDRPFAGFMKLRMWMYFISPVSFVLGILSYPPFILVTAILLISSMWRSFVFNQICLIAGLLPQDTTVWESTSSATTE